jgi:hypothetical protein
MTMPGAEGGGIFVSYRRQESSDFAGRLYDRLAGRFGESQVFIDVDTMEPGVDFAEEISRAVAACKVLLAVISPGWLTATDERGRHRLDDPDDIVRLEIEAALARSVRVIPILIGGAVMPGRQDLPESLAGLARRNALPIRHESFRYDAGRLVAAIERVLAAAPGPAAAAKVSSEDPGGKGALYAKFWERFLEDLKARHPGWTRARKGPYDNWLALPSPFKGSNEYSVGFPSRPPRLRAELYIDSTDPAEVETRFGDLYQHRDEIETAFGGELNWEALDGRRASRIATYTEGDVTQTDRHDEFIEWFIGSLEKLRSALDSHA